MKLRRTAVIVASMAVVFGGATAVSVGVSQAGESCDGLNAALRNNLNFIQDQRLHPDALSAARIENRQAVVKQIQQRRHNAGCATKIHADPVAAAAPGAAAPTAAPSTAASAPAAGVVCAGSTVTFFNEAAAPAATSGNFPVGTKLKVTNLDNDLSVTVSVTGPSGSCVLLNNAAFDQIHEAGKNLIRRALIEKVG